MQYAPLTHASEGEPCLWFDMVIMVQAKGWKDFLCGYIVLPEGGECCFHLVPLAH